MLAEIKKAPNVHFGPENPEAKTVSGYFYREVPAKTWAKVAGVDPDVAALAWCLVSEALHIIKYPRYSVAIAEIVCNAGVELVTKDQRKEFDGKFGQQSGRWCSSYHHPTHKQVKCAELAIARHRAGEPNLLAKGALQWLDCKTQIYMHSKKPRKNPAPETVLKSRYHVGRKWVGPVDEIDPFRLMMFGKDGLGIKEAQEATADGRKRWKLELS